MVDHGVSERVIDAVIAGRPEQVEEWLASLLALPNELICQVLAYTWG